MAKKKRKQSKSKVNSAPQSKPMKKNTITAIIVVALVLVAVVTIIFFATRNGSGTGKIPSTATDVTQKMINEIMKEEQAGE